MVLLLGSRGRTRARRGAGFGQALSGVVDMVFGRSQSRRRDQTRSSRSGAVSGWLALGAALVCFVAGFFAGGHWAAAGPRNDADRAKGALQAQGQAPDFIGEFDAKALASNAFVVSAYPNIEAATAKVKAKALSDFLRSQKVDKARPYEYPTANGPLWVVAVYYDGERELEQTRQELLGLPDNVPDATFVHLRKTEAEWPKAWPIR